MRTGAGIVAQGDLTYETIQRVKRGGGGQGEYTYADGSWYRGEWVQGARQGRGTCVYFNGSHYEGTWLQDEPHGLRPPLRLQSLACPSPPPRLMIGAMD